MTATATTSPDVTTGDAWSSLYCFVYWEPEHVDAFLVGTVAPMMNDLRDTRRVEDWFYIRYFENGPHLRIRARGADAATTAELSRRLAEAVRLAPYPREFWEQSPATWHEHGEIREVAYEPETERYGGTHALPIAEELFCRSSQIAVAAIAATPRHNQRLVAATDFVLATAIALDLDTLDTVRWLRQGAVAWRWHNDGTMLAPPMVQHAALSAATSQASAVVTRWNEIRVTAAAGDRLRDRWVRHIRSARARLEVGGETDRQRWLHVWGSQLHMLLNRMGIRPDEERSLDWFIAASLRAPDGPTDFFADHPAALDRHYLEASNFEATRMTWQQPRDVPPGQARRRWRLSAESAVALPEAAPITASLSEVLADRVTSRGDLGGTVTAQDLSNLLWPAYASRAGRDVTGYPQRPYPSAGARYVAQLRLIVRAIDGVPAGQYDVDQATRTLMPLGPAPTVAELAATSMWFSSGRPADDDTRTYDSVHLSTLPALLGLYVDLGALRARYGLRALRFALLEAGHLAQNLALAAAGTGLSLGLMGGFYDDVAHEVFLLDGIDDVLVYLLPLGRRAPG